MESTLIVRKMLKSSYIFAYEREVGAIKFTKSLLRVYLGERYHHEWSQIFLDFTKVFNIAISLYFCYDILMIC